MPRPASRALRHLITHGRTILVVNVSRHSSVIRLLGVARRELLHPHARPHVEALLALLLAARRGGL